MSWVWEHSPAQGSELLLLLALADFADDHGMNAYPSVARLARKCRIDRRTVQRILRRITEKGLLSTVGSTSGGRGRANRYRVVMSNISDAETAADRRPIEQQSAADRRPLEPETAADRPPLQQKRAAFDTPKGGTTMPPDPSGTVSNEGGYVTRATHVRARPPSNNDDSIEPPDRCAAHAADPDAPPCGACKEARIRHDRWTHDQELAARTAAATERREERRARNRAIHRCRLCDSAGYLPAGGVCNHDPDQAARNEAGRAQVEAVLAARKSTEE